MDGDGGKKREKNGRKTGALRDAERIGMNTESHNLTDAHDSSTLRAPYEAILVANCTLEGSASKGMRKALLTAPAPAARHKSLSSAHGTVLIRSLLKVERKMHEKEREKERTDRDLSPTTLVKDSRSYSYLEPTEEVLEPSGFVHLTDHLEIPEIIAIHKYLRYSSPRLALLELLCVLDEGVCV